MAAAQYLAAGALASVPAMYHAYEFSGGSWLYTTTAFILGFGPLGLAPIQTPSPNHLVPFAPYMITDCGPCPDPIGPVVPDPGPPPLTPPAIDNFTLCKLNITEPLHAPAKLIKSLGPNWYPAACEVNEMPVWQPILYLLLFLLAILYPSSWLNSTTLSSMFGNGPAMPKTTSAPQQKPHAHATTGASTTAKASTTTKESTTAKASTTAQVRSPNGTDAPPRAAKFSYTRPSFPRREVPYPPHMLKFREQLQRDIEYLNELQRNDPLKKVMSRKVEDAPWNKKVRDDSKDGKISQDAPQDSKAGSISNDNPKDSSSGSPTIPEIELQRDKSEVKPKRSWDSLDKELFGSPFATPSEGSEAGEEPPEILRRAGDVIRETGSPPTDDLFMMSGARPVREPSTDNEAKEKTRAEESSSSPPLAHQLLDATLAAQSGSVTPPPEESPYQPRNDKGKARAKYSLWTNVEYAKGDLDEPTAQQEESATSEAASKRMALKLAMHEGRLRGREGSPTEEEETLQQEQQAILDSIAAQSPSEQEPSTTVAADPSTAVTAGPSTAVTPGPSSAGSSKDVTSPCTGWDNGLQPAFPESVVQSTEDPGESMPLETGSPRSQSPSRPQTPVQAGEKSSSTTPKARNQEDGSALVETTSVSSETGSESDSDDNDGDDDDAGEDDDGTDDGVDSGDKATSGGKPTVPSATGSEADDEAKENQASDEPKRKKTHRGGRKHKRKSVPASVETSSTSAVASSEADDNDAASTASTVPASEAEEDDDDNAASQAPGEPKRKKIHRGGRKHKRGNKSAPVAVETPPISPETGPATVQTPTGSSATGSDTDNKKPARRGGKHYERGKRGKHGKHAKKHGQH